MNGTTTMSVQSRFVGESSGTPLLFPLPRDQSSKEGHDRPNSFGVSSEGLPFTDFLKIIGLMGTIKPLDGITSEDSYPTPNRLVPAAEGH